MDLVDRLVEHDLWLTERILECATNLPDPTLDDPIDQFVHGLDVIAEPTLRELLEAMVFTKEMWGSGMLGHAIQGPQHSTAPELLARWKAAAHVFRSVVRDIKARDGWDETFIRTTWAPPQLFTTGGAVAHTLTFSASRRALALRVLQARGLGLHLKHGDPVDWEHAGAPAASATTKGP